MSAGTVVVTGGASGIGARLVEDLAADRNVVVVDRAAPAAPVAGVRYLTADLTAADQLAAAAEQAGTGQPGASGTVDALVHCAGVMIAGPFVDAPAAEWRRVIEVNVAGTLATCQAFAPRIADDGRIVLFSSGTVFKGPGGVAAYAASKAAVIGFARSLATELGARGVTVNTIAPGLVRTPMTGELMTGEDHIVADRAIKRPATVDDLVEPVRFFLSPGAGFVTGQTLVVDGGATKH